MLGLFYSLPLFPALRPLSLFPPSLMFSLDNAHSLTLEELTWLSASTLIENQHALSVCPYSFLSTPFLIFNTGISLPRSRL